MATVDIGTVDMTVCAAGCGEPATHVVHLEGRWRGASAATVRSVCGRKQCIDAVDVEMKAQLRALLIPDAKEPPSRA